MKTRRFLHAATTRNCLIYIKTPLGRPTTNKSYPNSVLWSSSYEKAIWREEKHWNWQFEWNTVEISRSKDVKKCKIFLFHYHVIYLEAWNKIIDYRNSLFLYSIVVKSANDPLYGSPSYVYPSINWPVKSLLEVVYRRFFQFLAPFFPTEIIKSLNKISLQSILTSFTVSEEKTFPILENPFKTSGASRKVSNRLKILLQAFVLIDFLVMKTSSLGSRPCHFPRSVPPNTRQMSTTVSKVKGKVLWCDWLIS